MFQEVTASGEIKGIPTPLFVITGLLGLFVLMLLFSTPVSASDPQQVAGLEPVAVGLDSPRGVAFGSDGAMYVAEAGRRGEAPCMAGPEGEVCYGTSGAVTRVLDGQQERIASGLPSLGAIADGSGAVGPHDVVVRGSDVFILVGLGADPAARDNPDLPDSAADFGKLLRWTGTDA